MSGYDNNPAKEEASFREQFRLANEAKRKCLRCDKMFLSKSKENRICYRCIESIKRSKNME